MESTVTINGKNYFLIHIGLYSGMNTTVLQTLCEKLLTIGAIPQGTTIDRGFFHTKGSLSYYIPENKASEYTSIISSL